jgi:pyroglutamyl-peptidase
MRILITGFGPFGEHKINTSSLLIQAIENKKISYPTPFLVRTLLLPVTFKHSFEHLQDVTKQFNPDVIIATGLAAGRKEIHLEAVATNRMDATIEDNLGEKPQGKLISPKGPNYFSSTLPLFGIEGILQKHEIPVKISNDAGGFVCNYIFYRMMEENQHSQRLCGFIHLPLLREFSDQKDPSLGYDQIIQSFQLILNYINY